MPEFDIDACCFDVVGTLVDWRGTLAGELARLGARYDVRAGWEHLARRWAWFYSTGPLKSRSDLVGEGMAILADCGLEGVVTPEEARSFATAWERLVPWPDAPGALARMRAWRRCAAVTNLDRETAERLSESAGFAWDEVITAQDAGTRKPDPMVYLTAADWLGVPPGRILMVAAHQFDLNGARSAGFRTAYLRGRRDDPKPAPAGCLDFDVADLAELADRLGLPPVPGTEGA